MKKQIFFIPNKYLNKNYKKYIVKEKSNKYLVKYILKISDK